MICIIQDHMADSLWIAVRPEQEHRMFAPGTRELVNLEECLQGASLFPERFQAMRDEWATHGTQTALGDSPTSCYNALISANKGAPWTSGHSSL